MRTFRPRIGTMILTACGIGLIPVAPGTCGSAVTAVLIGLLVHSSLGAMNGWIVGAVIVILWPISLTALRSIKTGGRLDHPWIVIDEVIGMGVTLLPALFLHRASWKIVAIGFVLFRIFDIAKPFGIRAIDRKNTPTSVLLDDLVAGIFSAVLLAIVMVSVA